MKKIIDVEQTLEELKQIQDEGEEILFLKEKRKTYQAMSNPEKDIFHQDIAQKIEVLSSEVNKLCRE